MSPRPESWFDRLAAPHTRRQSLKAATLGAAATVAASLPFAGSPPKARAAPNPSDCRKGCVFVANQVYTSASRANTGAYFVETALFGVGGGVLGPIFGLLSDRVYRSAADHNWQTHREDLQSCFQPFCPGFDPHKEGGPCDGCSPPLSCNPCPQLENGYICCVYPEGDCHGDCCTPGPGC